MSFARLMLFLAVSLPLLAQEPVLNTTCPVLPEREVGEDAVTVVYQGKEVRLCCKRCRGRFLAEPSRYLDRLPQFASPPGAAGERHDHGDQHEHGGLLALAGRFHPVIVHFPVALLTLAFLLEAWSLLRGRQLYGPATRPLVLWGAATAVAAVLLGLALAHDSGYTGPLQDVFERHRALGIATAALAVAAAGLAEWGQRSGKSGRLRAYLATLLAGTVVLAVAAHQGGTLVYGLEYFF